MKHWILLLAALPVIACSDGERIAVVDVQQAFQRSPLVMVSAHQIKGDLGSRQRDLKKRGRAQLLTPSALATASAGGLTRVQASPPSPTPKPGPLNSVSAFRKPGKPG